MQFENTADDANTHIHRNLLRSRNTSASKNHNSA